MFPSTLGPVVALDIHTANEIIAGLGVKSDAFDASGDYATDSDERRCGPVQSSVDDGPTAGTLLCLRCLHDKSYLLLTK